MTGRWLSNDPIGISGGLNQYAALNNNPLNFVDPFGLADWNWINKSDKEMWSWAEAVGRQRRGRMFTIAAHGLSERKGGPAIWLADWSSGTRISRTPQDVFDMLISKGSGYVLGKDVYLAGCNTAGGEGSFVRRLSALLSAEAGRTVYVWGHTGIIQGEWIGAAAYPRDLEDGELDRYPRGD